MSRHDSKPPFAGHPVYYYALKLVVVVAALALATRLVGLW
jgi:hypothetical protein